VQHSPEQVDQENWLHKHLVDEFETVVGVDILTDGIREMRQAGYTVRYADVTSMQLDVRADTVVAGELIEHVANPGNMLERVREHLKPDGSLVLSTPNPWAVVQLKRRVFGTESVNEEHVAWYGPRTLETLLNRHGFTIEKLRTTRRDHKGLQRVAQYFDSDYFGGSTWVLKANHECA
jgi:2-polyprenyl-3-methyl-5-hydroxy-6-metoxy-1,4-benzoquinol methylase